MIEIENRENSKKVPSAVTLLKIATVMFILYSKFHETSVQGRILVCP